MAFYQDPQTLCAVMTDLFQRVMATPAARHQLRRTGLVLRIVLADPDFVLTVDGKSIPPGFACGSGRLPPDLVLRMPADVLHRVWLSEIRLRDAYSSGQIKVDGLLVRAFGLAHLFREVEAIYPLVLHDKGLLAGGGRDQTSP